MPETLNRRQFIDRAALGAAGLAATARLARAEDAPSEKVIIGIMGLSRGLDLANRFVAQPNVELRYVCDTDSDRVAQAVDTVEKAGSPKPKGIGDFRKILDDKEVDALICAAPNHWHAPATILGCSAGKHVYVEKPCSHNPWEAETMVESARKHKRVVI